MTSDDPAQDDPAQSSPEDLPSPIDLTIGDDQAGMEHRRERIAIETSNHHIEGYLTIAREGYRSRVSDVLNASERDFLTLTDVTVQTLGDNSTTTPHPFLAIARRHIIFAVVLGAHAGESDIQDRTL